MNIAQVKALARSGDVFLVDGNSIVSEIIQVATHESFSHVAMSYKTIGELRVVEMIEGIGFRNLSFDEWFPAMKGDVYFGKAPWDVRCQPRMLPAYLSKYKPRNKKSRYGWFTLPLIWLAQKFNWNIRTDKEVCSTFVQDYWEMCGYKGFTRLADPGDFKEHADSISIVRGGT